MMTLGTHRSQAVTGAECPRGHWSQCLDKRHTVCLLTEGMEMLVGEEGESGLGVVSAESLGHTVQPVP